MPVRSCTEGGKSGYSWGNQKCYTYSDEASRKQAKRKAFIQGYAAVKNGAKAGYDVSIAENLSLQSVQSELNITDDVLEELDDYFTKDMSEEDICKVHDMIEARCPC